MERGTKYCFVVFLSPLRLKLNLGRTTSNQSTRGRSGLSSALLYGGSYCRSWDCLSDSWQLLERFARRISN